MIIYLLYCTEKKTISLHDTPLVFYPVLILISIKVYLGRNKYDFYLMFFSFSIGISMDDYLVKKIFFIFNIFFINILFINNS